MDRVDIASRGDLLGSVVVVGEIAGGGLDGSDWSCCLRWEWICVLVAIHSSEGCSNTNIGYR